MITSKGYFQRPLNYKKWTNYALPFTAASKKLDKESFVGSVSCEVNRDVLESKVYKKRSRSRNLWLHWNFAHSQYTRNWFDPSCNDSIIINEFRYKKHRTMPNKITKQRRIEGEKNVSRRENGTVWRLVSLPLNHVTQFPNPILKKKRKEWCASQVIHCYVPFFSTKS